MSKTTRSRAEILRLVVFCSAVVVGSSLALRPFVAKKERFDTATFKRMRDRQPEFVLIGDSLLGYSIDPQVLESVLGKKIEVLWHPGAASAAWYLYLKNFIAAAGVHPRRVFILIHDEVLTEPKFRTTGKYAQALQRLRRSDEPLLRALTNEPSPRWSMAHIVATLFPADANRAHYQQKADGWVRRLVSFNRSGARKLATQTNAVFDVPKLRADQPLITVEAQKPFAEAVRASFLPHMIGLAHESGYALSFVRPEKRPGPDADFDDSPAMREYYRALESYLRANGCELIDLTGDPSMTAGMFSDGAHILPWAKEAFTRHFAEQLGARFQ